jgi:hypothetical protein
MHEMPDNYINIGSVKSCFFVPISLFLIKQLKRKPLLYFSVEEAIRSASMGCYGIGILAFSQILNVFNQKTPTDRHMVAHEFLTMRPTKEMFDKIVQEVKLATKKQSDREQKRYPDAASYQETVMTQWGSFITQLHGIDEKELDNK